MTCGRMIEIVETWIAKHNAAEQVDHEQENTTG